MLSLVKTDFYLNPWVVSESSTPPFPFAKNLVFPQHNLGLTNCYLLNLLMNSLAHFPHLTCRNGAADLSDDWGVLGLDRVGAAAAAAAPAIATASVATPPCPMTVKAEFERGLIPAPRPVIVQLKWV